MAALSDRQHAHELIERVPSDQIVAAVRFLEFLLLDSASRRLATAPFEDEEISEEEEQAVARSKEWFKHHEGIPFEQVAAECGFTVEQIRNNRPDEEHKDPAASSASASPRRPRPISAPSRSTSR